MSSYKFGIPISNKIIQKWWIKQFRGKKGKINEERKKAQDTTKKLNVSDIRH